MYSLTYLLISMLLLYGIVAQCPVPAPSTPSPCQPPPPVARPPSPVSVVRRREQGEATTQSCPTSWYELWLATLHLVSLNLLDIFKSGQHNSDPSKHDLTELYLSRYDLSNSRFTKFKIKVFTILYLGPE